MCPSAGVNNICHGSIRLGCEEHNQAPQRRPEVLRFWKFVAVAFTATAVRLTQPIYFCKSILQNSENSRNPIRYLYFRLAAGRSDEGSLRIVAIRLQKLPSVHQLSVRYGPRCRIGGFGQKTHRCSWRPLRGSSEVMLTWTWLQVYHECNTLATKKTRRLFHGLLSTPPGPYGYPQPPCFQAGPRPVQIATYTRSTGGTGAGKYTPPGSNGQPSVP